MITRYEIMKTWKRVSDDVTDKKEEYDLKVILIDKSTELNTNCKAELPEDKISDSRLIKECFH